MEHLLLRVRALDVHLVVVLAASGCGPVSCEPEPERGVIAIEPVEEHGWPRAIVPDLAAATPRTEVTLRADRVEVQNEALVATWPESALARARRASEAPDWPRIAENIPFTDQERSEALEAALMRARRAERAATAEGTGAGAFNLRVASDVPFIELERVLRAAARAGYGAPWIVLDAGEVERVLRWPSARPSAGPSREAIEAALRGEGSALAPPPPRARVVLTNDRVSTATDEPACAIEGPLEPRAIERCARALRAAGEQVTLEVAPEARFDRVASMVQVLATTLDELRVVRGPAP